MHTLLLFKRLKRHGRRPGRALPIACTKCTGSSNYLRGGALSRPPPEGFPVFEGRPPLLDWVVGMMRFVVRFFMA